jgi:uncharacterized protein (UPF0254 family)
VNYFQNWLKSLAQKCLLEKIYPQVLGLASQVRRVDKIFIPSVSRIRRRLHMDRKENILNQSVEANPCPE